MKIYRMIIILVLLISAEAMAGNRLQHEKWYQEKYCTEESEAVLDDGTRVDCLTATHAIEYDFGNSSMKRSDKPCIMALRLVKSLVLC